MFNRNKSKHAEKEIVPESGQTVPEGGQSTPEGEQSSPDGERRRRRFTPARIIGILLILAGLAVLGYIPYTWVNGQLEQRSLRGQFEDQSASAMALNQSVLDRLQGAADLEKLKQLAIAYRGQLTNHEAIAELEIPRMGKNLVVVEGDDDEALKMGTFHMPSTQLPGEGGNFVVGGDRVLYGAPFLYLNELNNGDTIIVHTQYGTFNYSVIDKRIVDPEDASLVGPQVDQNGVPFESVALFTCDPPWGTSHRLFVLGRLTGATVNQPAHPQTSASTPPAS